VQARSSTRSLLRLQQDEAEFDPAFGCGCLWVSHTDEFVQRVETAGESNSSTESVKPPELVLGADLLNEAEGNISGRTTPSSFRESPIGWGMSLVCGGIGHGTIDSRGALQDYYQEATFQQQQDILHVLSNNDKENRLSLLAESMFHACAKNFLESHSKRVRSRSTLFVYDSIEDFNQLNTMKDQVKKFKLSSVQSQLAGRNSQMVADNILNVCGALGMPYEAMTVLLNRPELVYKSFKSTFGLAVPNVNGTNRGYALWVLYAAARQSYEHATSYVVDDMFYIDVNSNNSQDEDIDKILNEIGVFAEVNPSLLGYRLNRIGEVYRFVPDINYVAHKFSMMVNKANERYWDDHPENLNAHLLQLAYVLNPYQEEFSAILGILQQTSNFVPNINCNVGSTPINIQALIASHESVGNKMYCSLNDDNPGNDLSLKYHVTTLLTVLARTFRHYARHYKDKLWYINGSMLSIEQKAQMKKQLFDLVIDADGNGWGDYSFQDWGGDAP